MYNTLWPDETMGYGNSYSDEANPNQKPCHKSLIVLCYVFFYLAGSGIIHWHTAI